MDSSDKTEVCVICYERSAGTRVEPCGHDIFCTQCVSQLRACPLCRVPLILPSTGTPAEASANAAFQQPSVISSQEQSAVALLCTCMWLFIFVVGTYEYTQGVPSSCMAGDPHEVGGLRHFPALNRTDIYPCSQNCTLTQTPCYSCVEGFFNYGAQCFKFLENLPSLTVGAELGGQTYFNLIIFLQLGGVTAECLLIGRMLKRRLLPRKEMIVLGSALIVEISRMLLVDLFVLQDYFGGRSYSIFRAPVHCGALIGQEWRGADAQLYCHDLSPHGKQTAYYIATSREAFSSDSTVCSTFTRSSALLDFGRVAPTFLKPGGPRFENLGWIIGGEFALYYVFATFVNELADTMFVVPTSTNMGWFCKSFSIALELFQLGALCPAAIFHHGDCLHYTEPLGTSLHLISFVVTAFGYAVWAFVFLALPLAIIGIMCLNILYIFYLQLVGAAGILRTCSQRTFILDFANYLERGGIALLSYAELFRLWMQRSAQHGVLATLLLAFIPMLLGGMFLGTLVVIGQASKKGSMQVLTAFVLLADVLLKIVATAVIEALEYTLHLRVRREVANRARANVPAAIVGRPAATVEDGEVETGQAGT